MTARKPAERRQRGARTKDVGTVARLPVAAAVTAPPAPLSWRPEVLEAWAEFWSSPMADPKVLRSTDQPALQRLFEYRSRLLDALERFEAEPETTGSMGQPVLSPCDCTVLKVGVNATTNVPGVLGKPPASMVVLQAADGTRVVLAHVQSLSVKEGEQVRAGQAIARVGNNGYSRMPHIHIGAWKDKQALQIRWDQRAMPVP